MHIAKPTEKQLVWQDLELGVLIHYLLDNYKPDCHMKEKIIAEEIPASSLNPSKLDPEQWVRAACEMGAKYAVLVAKHGTGFALWPTDVNDYSCKYMKWKDGQGDIVGEFVAACRKYGLKPGLYYHPTCNGYYGINNELTYDYKGEMYQNYVRCVERQVEELWSRYGDLFEIWFDGGCLPVEDGGPDLYSILKKYQPDAVAFQGPKEHPHNLRWVGNEDGLAPENCWATTNAGEARYDGTVPHEEAGVGDPDGKYYWPAETDMPNRDHAAFGGGWGWQPNEADHAYSPDYLLDCYVRSVGRNSNLLVGMAITTDGDFQDEEQFRAFGKLLRETFGTPLTVLDAPVPDEAGFFTLTVPEGKTARYLVIREDIREGQRIRGFEVFADGEKIYASQCVGHKRIVPLGENAYKTVSFRVTEGAEDWRIRDIALA